MDRRKFLMTAGASPALAAALPTAALGLGTRPFLDEEKLAGRNGNRSTLACQNGIVCASQPLAAMAGVDILKAGGNCIDAAIATNAVLGLTEPQMDGMGGDLFAIVWSQRDQRLYGLNASGRAPYAWNLDEAARLGLAEIPRVSPLSWTVPGCVSGWAALNERFGSLSLGRCLEPAIEYAEEGFPLSPVIASYFESDDPFATVADSSLSNLYRPNGETPGFGDIFRNPDLARSYRQVAEGGSDAFYRGEIAERIVAKSEQMNGFMAMRDLAEHSPQWVDPVSTNYRGYDVWELPPNGQGITVLQMLNLLEHFDFSDVMPNSTEHLHLLLEAKKLAFEDRARYYADPDFADVPVEWLISKEYAAERVELIDPGVASRSIGPGDPKLDRDTIYMTCADHEGNMISLIQSIFWEWGSTICPDGVGFAMQNRGEAFSLDPNHPNRLEPHKRPFHTIIPAFVTEAGRPLLSFGVMGGAFQPQGHVQVLMNMFDFGMSPQQAGDQPRIQHTGIVDDYWSASSLPEGGIVTFERGIPNQTKLRLAEKGHNVGSDLVAPGGYQAIWRTDEPLIYFGGSDPRKDGAALGF